MDIKWNILMLHAAISQSLNAIATLIAKKILLCYTSLNGLCRFMAVTFTLFSIAGAIIEQRIKKFIGTWDPNSI